MNKIVATLAFGAVALVLAASAEAKVSKVSFTGVVSPNDYATLTVKSRHELAARSR